MFDHGTNSAADIPDSNNSRSPSPETQREASPTDSEASSGTREEPKYSAEELAAMFLDFYKFLATLHFDIKDLHVPPPGGWPSLIPESYSSLKSPHVISTLKLLPYYTSPSSIHYKSHLTSYAHLPSSFFLGPDWHEDGIDFFTEEGEEVDPKHCLAIAWGHESGGRDFWLNVWDGEVIEEELRCQGNGAVDVVEWIEGMKEEFRELRLVPGEGRVVIEAGRVDEFEEGKEISEEDVVGQEHRWFTDLDVQFVRQVYRKHGWPGNFRKEEAFAEIDKLMEKIDGKRGQWEGETGDYN